MITTLTILQRLALLRILPNEGGLLDIRAVHNLRQSIAPSDEEAAAIQLAAGSTGYLDDRSPIAHKTIEVEISPRAVAIVQDILTDLDRRKKLPESCISLWDIFFEEQQP